MSQNVRILLIEPNPQDARVIREVLSREATFSFECETVSSIQSAHTSLRKGTFHIILTSLSPIDSKGLPTIRKIKAVSEQIPIVAMLDWNEKSIAPRLISEGAQDYLVKGPVDKEDLLRVLRQAVERKKTLDEVVVWEQRFQAVMQAVGQVLYEWDTEKNVVTYAGDYKKLLGYDDEALGGGLARWLELVHPDDRARVTEAREKLRSTGKPFQGEYRVLCDNGTYLPVLDRVFPVSIEGEVLKRMVGVLTDVSGRKRAEAELEKLSLAVEQSPSIVMITNAEGIIEYVNLRFTDVTGFQPEEVIGKTPRVLKSGKMSDDEFKRLWETIKAGREWQGEFLNRKKNGELYWERARISPIRSSDGTITHFVALKEDITSKKRAEATIEHMAYHDPLTDLPNRVLFNDRLSLALAQARRKNQLLAIFFLDLDRFKVINDTLGHNLGDLLLQSVSARLRGCIGEGDTLARLGGDEFMFLFPGISHVEDAAKLAQKALESLQPSFSLGGHEIHITPSIGISIFPYDGDDAVTLLKNADTALNRAKEQGRTNYQLYTPVMNAKAFERMALENSLRKALEREEFVVYYQPQVDIQNGEIFGMEALLRWLHPDLGLVSPAQFIPLAEETGLIIPIGEWVLRHACEQNKLWLEQGLPQMSISVNLSGRQFSQDNLVSMISSILRESGLQPQFLDLEITESTIVSNLEATVHNLRDLTQAGIHISIDDFGTGYSSLSYLKKFPIRTLKIDQSFIREITTDPDDAAITAAVIAMAHQLKLKVVAEGVETMEQLELLKTLKCDSMQGFLFSRPVPAETISRLLGEGWRLKAS